MNICGIVSHGAAIFEIRMKFKEKAKNLKKDIPAIFLALKDKRTPLIAKLFAAVTIAYALSPIDLIPDFIPIIGALDDLILLPLLAALTIRLIPCDILEQCRQASENLRENGKPKKWYYAVPVILFWLLIAAIVLKELLQKCIEV